MTTLTEQGTETIADPGTEVRAQAKALGPIITYTEEYRCPRCDARLPSECIDAETLGHAQTPRVMRRVSIYCPHCNVGFKGVFGLRDGQLVPLGSAELCDEAETGELRASVELYRGTRSLARRPPPPVSAQEVAAELQRLESRARARETRLHELRTEETRLLSEDVREQCRRYELEHGGIGLTDAAAARARIARNRRPPDPIPSPLDGAAMTAGEDAHAEAQAARTLDRSTDQGPHPDDTDPGRDYEPN
jgi:hypothetical protein